MSYTIRHATTEDIPTILDLIRELAVYEKSLSQVTATVESLRSTLSFPSPSSSSSSTTGFTPGYAKTFLLTPSPSSPSPSPPTTESGEAAVVIAGLAIYFHNYSTWTSAPGIYLEDLFVRPQFRGKGYGKALLRELAREALRTGCTRLDWSVLKWNTPSIDFYLSEGVGGTVLEEWQGVRVEAEGGGLGRLAGEGWDVEAGVRG